MTAPHHTAAGWQQLALPAAPVVTSTITLDPGGTLWAAGYVPVTPAGAPFSVPDLRLEQDTGDGWQPETTTDPSPYVYPSSLLVKADGTAWIAGSLARTTPGGPPGQPPFAGLVHWDGTAWTSVALPNATIGTASVSGDSQGNPEWVIGTTTVAGTIENGYLKYENGAWVRMPTAPDTGPESGIALIYGITPVPGTQASIAVGEVGLGVASNQYVPRIETEDSP